MSPSLRTATGRVPTSSPSETESSCVLRCRPRGGRSGCNGVTGPAAPGSRRSVSGGRSRRKLECKRVHAGGGGPVSTGPGPRRPPRRPLRGRWRQPGALTAFKGKSDGARLGAPLCTTPRPGCQNPYLSPSS